jgi:hypothetical protein
MVPDEVVMTSDAAIQAGLVERDRQLLQTVQATNEKLNSRGILHSSIQTGLVTDLFIAELQPRADFIGQSYHAAFVAFAKSPKARDVDDFLRIVEKAIQSEFERLVTVYASGLLTLEKDAEAKRLRAAFDIPRKKTVTELRMKFASSSKEVISVFKRISGPAWALILVLVAAYLTNEYNTNNEERKQRLATEKEVGTALVSKLEMFRAPSVFITRASEATSEGDYSREMIAAMRATELALDSLSAGYPLLQTRVTQAFGVETTHSVDSIGKKAVILRDALQESLDALRRSFSQQPPVNPGEHLTAAEDLESRVTRVEKSIYFRK